MADGVSKGCATCLFDAPNHFPKIGFYRVCLYVAVYFLSMPTAQPQVVKISDFSFLSLKWPTGSPKGVLLGYLTLRTTSAK